MLVMSAKTTKEDPQVISFQTLRKAVGWLGICLPVVMLVGNAVLRDCYKIQDSVSHYYYTVTGDLFVGILCAVALFLFAYKGYEGDSDNIWTNLAGFFALCIAMFPTNDNSLDRCSFISLPDNEIRRIIHYVSAGAFFLILAGISLFLFTRSDKEKTKEKAIRNKIYRTCGVTILLSVVAIAIYGLAREDTGWGPYKLVFLVGMDSADLLWYLVACERRDDAERPHLE